MISIILEHPHSSILSIIDELGHSLNKRGNTMETYLETPREIPVYGKFDVVVVGGGFAGVGAAVAAARSGAETLLVERYSSFGGTGTIGLMNNINGFRNQVKPDHIQTSKGLAEETILRLKKINGLGNAAYIQEEYETTPGKLSFGYAVDPEKVKLVLLQMLSESNCSLLLNTYFSDAIVEENHIRGIIVENKGGRFAIYGKVVIDASGDADVAYRAGVPFWQVTDQKTHHLDAGLMYRVSGYDVQKREEGDGCQIEDTLTLWGPKAKLLNALDPNELTAAEIRTRLSIYQDLEDKKAEKPWLANANIVESASLLGVRQTRFIKGEYTITVDDVLEGKTFDDSIAMASKPIIAFFGYRRYLEHAGYDIPYRCMLPQKIEGLLVAGRCMSSDQAAFESWRSMGPVMCLGQAAGMAAALSVESKVIPRKVVVKELQQRLKDAGAEIGQSRNL